jgi:hypothetical protein
LLTSTTFIVAASKRGDVSQEVFTNFLLLLPVLMLSGGQGMVVLPMEPKEVTQDILKEVFPSEDVLEKWYNGEDAAWPPEPEPQELRFQVGTDVLCRVGPTDWAPGKVQQLWYRESGWPEGAFAPYKILLADGRDIFAPQDMDQIIRLDPNGNMRVGASINESAPTS